MRKIPLYAYVASNNPHGAAEVIRQFGLMPPQNQEDVFRGLRHVQSTFGREGLMEIAKAHPDKDLIIATIPKSEDKESKSSACGCHSGINGVGSVDSATKTELEKIREERLLEKIEASKNPLTKEDIAAEVKREIEKTNPFIKNNLPYLALGGVALFFVWGTLRK